MFFFFFSSRRRHTRLQGDWSSDVCSSDLFARLAGGQSEALPTTEWSGRRANAPLPTLRIAAPPGLGRAAMRSIYQRCAKRIEEMTGAALTGSGVVIAVEERTLLEDLERGLS